MPKGYPRTSCKHCGRPVSECGPLSKRGLCAEDSEARMNANLVSLVAHSGPYFDHWRNRSLAALGVFVVDDAERKG
jgi:hypothetical protein